MNDIGHEAGDSPDAPGTSPDDGPAPRNTDTVADEALSDDGTLTGRGRPWIRGWVTGAMTTIGGVGHTLPYLIPDFHIATAVAVAVVMIELWIIAWIRARYMDTPFLRAAFEIVVGGLIVFGAGVLIGNA